LRLTATPPRDHLLRLLEEHGAAGIKFDPDPRLIMSGGGSGFSLWDTKNSATNKPAPPPQDPPQVTTPRSSPEQGSAPREHKLDTD
jgi:hypothetical protein